MAYARKFRKFGRWAKKNIVQPYTAKKGGRGYKNRMRLYSEVAALKKMVNAEKQNAESAVTTEYDLAQYAGVSTTGMRVLDILPTISQGVGEDNRKGDSLKVCSWVLKLHTYNNGNLTLPDVNYRFYVLRQPTNPVSTTLVQSQFLETNTFSSVVDYHSSRDYEHFKDYIVMGQVNGKLKSIMGGTSSAVSSANTHTLARKQEFHIRYEKGTTTVLNNPIYLVAVASDGDRTTTNEIYFKYSFKVFFYDN